MLVNIRDPEKLIYPETDGKPMGENTLQFQWILTLFYGIENLFFDRDDIFVAGDLFWYPVHGDPTTVTAPDIMVVFGRPKKHRASYKQWEEGDLAPQVVFEIRSPSNTADDVLAMKAFYQQFGVAEFYLYDPANEVFEIAVRSGKRLKTLPDPNGFVSPRMGVRFEMPDGGPLRIIRPDGRAFLSYNEIITEADLERKRAEALAAKLRELGIDPETIR
jgi:Uma2 family endonuclease